MEHWLAGRFWSFGGLAFLAFLITWIGVANLISRSIPVTQGTLTVDGSGFKGPGEGQVIDLSQVSALPVLAPPARPEPACPLGHP